MTDLFRRLFPTRTRPNRARRAQPTFRPTVTCLDRRDLPAVTFNGGPLLSHVDVHTVFYGQNWSSYDSLGIQRAELSQFQSDITKSAYLAMLGEYGVGRGQFGGSDGVYGSAAPAANSTVTETQIQTMLSGEINSGKLPEETGKQLYFVYLSPNVKSQFDQTNGFFAHHGSFLMQAVHYVNVRGISIPYYTTDTVYYAVVQHPQTTGDVRGLSDYQSLTELSSHELAEAVTDPDIRQSGNNTDWANSHLAWIDNNQFTTGTTKNPKYRSEIGDYVNGQYASFVANGTSYTVQKEWSVYYGGGILANGGQGGLLDASGTNTHVFSSTWSYSTTVDGRTMTVHRAIGVDGRWCTNFEIAPGDYSGWFTFNS